MRNKILIITPSGVGGAEKVLALYGKILGCNNFDVTFLLVNQIGIEDLSLVPFIPLNAPKEVCTCKFSNLPFVFHSRIKRMEPDVVFCAHPYYAIILMALRAFHLLKSKIVFRDNNMPSSHSVRTQKLLRRFAKQSTLFLSQTEEMKSEMLLYYGVPNEKVICIHNPIDKEAIIENIKSEGPIFPEGQKVFLFSGRIAPQKDIDTLVMAFDIVRRQFDNAHLYMIGFDYLGSEYTNHVQVLIASCHLDDRIHILGFQSNPHKFVAKADVFVLSSIYEGMPNAMLDAMYIGIPVATTTCIPYISRVIKDGINGYTCDVKDPAGLADAMIKASELTGIEKYIDVNNSEDLIIKAFTQLCQYE